MHGIRRARVDLRQRSRQIVPRFAQYTLLLKLPHLGLRWRAEGDKLRSAAPRDLWQLVLATVLDHAYSIDLRKKTQGGAAVTAVLQPSKFHMWQILQPNKLLVRRFR